VWCRHGTSAIESLSWFDETDLQLSSGAAEAADAEDAAVAADAEDVEADDAGRVTGPSLVRSTTLSSSSESLLSAGGCSASVCPPTEWLTTRRNCSLYSILDPCVANHVGFLLSASFYAVRSGCVASVYSTSQQRSPINNWACPVLHCPPLPLRPFLSSCNFSALTLTLLYTVFRKKHPLTFSFISPRIICAFKQKLQWIYLRNGRFWPCRN